jgi:predicted nucleotidyltransferase
MVLQQVNRIGNIIAPSTLAAVVYHNLFGYPLTSGELIRWEVAQKLLKPYHLPKDISYQKGFYFIEGQEGLLTKRILRKRTSLKKIEIAKRAAGILKIIKSIKGVFLTGSVAMENADPDSDIDLMFITSPGKLWTTRILVYLLLTITGFGIRRYGVSNQKDKLCLNMWLTEDNLVWPEKGRNIFSAHEIIQVKPLLNRNCSYERLIAENSWVNLYWPNALQIKEVGTKVEKYPIQRQEQFMFNIQKKYMQGKITKEVVGIKRAIFHPINLWPEIARKLRISGFKI